MTRPGHAFCVAAVLAAGTGVSGQAGTFVIGDTTQLFSLTNAFPTNALPDNQLFYRNLLGSGTSVGVYSFASSVGGTGDDEALAFYDGLTGVTATSVAGTITGAAIGGFDLFLIAALDRSPSQTEADALKAFSDAGNTLILGADPAQSLADTVPRMNSLLSKLGSSLSLSTTLSDIGSQTATGSAIEATSVTAGLTSIAYGAASEISGGGTPLLRLKNGNPFAVYDGPAADISQAPTTAAIPLPAAGWMMLSALGALMLRRKS
jgi:hypothetical protein